MISQIADDFKYFAQKNAFSIYKNLIVLYLYNCIKYKIYAVYKNI